MLNKSFFISTFFTLFLIFPLNISGYSLQDLKYKINLDIIDQSSILIKSVTNAKEDIWNKQTFAATAKSNNGYYIFFGGGLNENTTSDRYKKRKKYNFIEELANSTNDVIIDRKKKLNVQSEILKCKKDIYVDWYDYVEKNNTDATSEGGLEFNLCYLQYLIEIGMNQSIYDKITKAIKDNDSNFSFTQDDIQEMEKYEKKLISEHNFMTIYGIESLKKQNNIEYQLFNIETIQFYWRCIFLTKYEKNIKDTFLCINPSSGFKVDDNIEIISNLIND